MYYYGPAAITREYFMERLVDSPPPVIAVDCETISLTERMPVGFSIATAPNESFYFQTFPEPDPALHYLTKILTDPQYKKVFHNAPFDLRNIPLVAPIDMTNIADTAVMARLLGREDARLFMLAIEVNKETTPAKVIIDRYKAKTMLELPVEEVAKHCTDDSKCTLALYHQYLPNIDPAYFAIEMEVVPILIDMGLRGVKFSESDRAAIEQKLEADLEYYKNMIVSQGVENPNSGRQIGFILAKRGNFLPLTKSRKQLKTDEDTLEFLDDPLAQVVLSYKHNNTLLTKYIWPMRGKDRVYTNYNLDARVGRISSSDMNLQNIPGKNPTRPRVEHYNIRNIIVPDSGVYVTGDYCLAPSTRILTSDLRWVCIDDTSIGDELIGIDEQIPGGSGNTRLLRYTSIINKRPVRLPSVRLTTSDGRVVICSLHHPWLTRKIVNWKGVPRTRYSYWEQTKNIRVGSEIRNFAKPWSTIPSWEAGYIAGALDGEGYSYTNIKNSTAQVGFVQNDNAMLYEYTRCLDHLNIPYLVSFHSNKHSYLVRTNGVENISRLIGSTRPKRILEKMDISRFEPPDTNPWIRIESVEPVGEQDLVSIETTTHTFIAEGLFTHNSQEHLYIIMHLSGDRQMKRVYVDGEMNGDIHSFTAQMIFGTVNPNTRKIAKTLNYAIAYGATAKTISQQARIPDIRKCSEFLDKWFKTFREAAEWIKGAQREGIRDGWSLPTLFGRRIKLPVGEEEEGIKSKAVNYPVQGSDGEVMKRALIICKKHNLPLALTVHDSITVDGDCEFPVDELEHIAPVRIPFEVSKTLRWE